MGRAQRNPSPSRCHRAGDDGFRCALPILRGGKSAAGFGGDRERALALGVVEDVGGQQQLVGTVALDEGRDAGTQLVFVAQRSEEQTSELQSLMSISYAVFCLKKKNKQ